MHSARHFLSNVEVPRSLRGSGTDLPKTVDVDKLTIHETNWGDIHVNTITCHKTLDIAPLLKGLPNDLCQCPHWGIVLKGRKVVKYKNHEETLNSGDEYYMESGHSTITDAGTEWLEFTPSIELKKTNEAVAKNLAAMGQR
jgi:hypothetical protein